MNFKHYNKNIKEYFFRNNDNTILVNVDIGSYDYTVWVYELSLQKFTHERYKFIKNNSVQLNDGTIFSFDNNISKETFEKIKSDFYQKQRDLEENKNQELVKSALSLGTKEQVVSDKELFEKFCNKLIEKNPNFFNQTEKGLQIFSESSYHGPTKLIYEKFGQYFYFINDREITNPSDFFFFKHMIIEISKSYISKYESVQDEFFVKLNNLLENK